MANFKHVAVIGGGISGLSSLYYLIQRVHSAGQCLILTLYESKNALGGNAETVTVDLGMRVNPEDPSQHRYQRWADLGVNDMNLSAYPETEKLMQAVGYLEHLKPLQNSECYWAADGSVELTDDNDLTFGVSDPDFNLNYVDGGKFAQLIKVIHQAGLDKVKDEYLPTSYTVAQFFNDCMNQPQAMLTMAAAEVGISVNWNDPELKIRIKNIRDRIYYPRISAMYFTDDRGPGLMPLAAPFNYYRIQEGGAQKPNRRYFDGGAQKWLEMLSSYIQKNMASAQVRVIIRRNTPVSVVHLSANKVIVETAQGTVEHDMCIMATHADDALKVLRFAPDLAQEGQQLSSLMRQVRYTRSFAVCHTDAGCMPHNKNIWRTYNVPVRKPSDSQAYNIHYVVNLHQNDHNVPAYDHAGLPQYFVSLVEDLSRIPAESMLNRVNYVHQLSPQIRHVLPKATVQRMQDDALQSGYTSQMQQIPQELNGKAWTMFKHNVLDANCMQAQRDLQAYQAKQAASIAAGSLPRCRLFFSGGWTNGAGLHEQCLMQAQQVSQWLMPSSMQRKAG